MVRPERLFCAQCEGQLPKEPLSREFPLGNRTLPVLAALPYRDGFRQALHRLKFQQERSLALPMAQAMAQAAGGLLIPGFPQGFDGVAWVPMSPEKLRARGYNQSELLARYLARELGLPPLPLLRQTRQTQPQHSLSRPQRADNVRNAYAASQEARGRRVLLVDDIVTTGATLRACAQALYQAGAQDVACLCAANTPYEGPKA